MSVAVVVEAESQYVVSVSQPESATTQPDPEEAQLTAEVESLWAEHQKVNGLKKSSSADLRRIREELSRKLFEVKNVVSRPGRSGGWSAFLKQHDIPRATADRWVDRYAESIGQPNNCLNESISDEDAVEKLLTFLAAKLKKVLPDDIARYQAAYRLLEKLGLQVKEDDESFIVLEPESEPHEPYDEESNGDILLVPELATEEGETGSISGATAHPRIDTELSAIQPKRQIEM